MPIILAGASCDDCERLFFDRKPAVDWRNAERVEDSASLLSRAEPPNMGAIREWMGRSWIIRDLPKPLHVLVEGRDTCRNNRLVRARAGGIVPPNSFISLGGGVYICSPEYRFLRSGKTKYLPAQADYGTELCGIYLLYPGSEDGFVKCVPRTTPELIARYLERCEGVHGIKQARAALPFVLGNARSPMESTITVILVLPPRWGGYRLEGIALNVPVETNLDIAHDGISDMRTCDIYFDDVNVDIEYQGSHRHAGARKMRADDHRRILLENAGVKVITLSYDDASNVSIMNRVVDRIRGLRGIRPEALTREELETRNALFASLMPGSTLPCDVAAELAMQKRSRRPERSPQEIACGSK